MSEHLHLSRTHQEVLRRIFQHPITHNLEWRLVISLFEAIGEVTQEAGDHIKFTLNGESVTFHRPRHKDVADPQEVVDLRHFLERKGFNPQSHQTADAKQLETRPHLLVVLTHHDTKLFEVEITGDKPTKLTPYDPHNYRHHLHHTAPEPDGRGYYSPEDPHYYEDIAAVLKDAFLILIFENANGHSGAGQHLLDYLEQHHPEILERVAGIVNVDIEALTDAQMLAEARTFYAQLEPDFGFVPPRRTENHY